MARKKMPAIKLDLGQLLMAMALGGAMYAGFEVGKAAGREEVKKAVSEKLEEL